MEVAFDIRQGIIYMVENGDFNVDRYLDAIDAILKSPDHLDGMSIIVDRRLLTTPASSQQMHALRDALDTQKFRRFRPRCYAMVTRTEIGRLQAKLASTLIGTRVSDAPENFAVRRFQTIADAEDWIRQSTQ